MTRKAVPPAASTTDPASPDVTGVDQNQSQSPAQTPSFEDQLAELEALVDTLEHGDLSLEQSLAVFERGVMLTRTCQQALDTAEQKVRILTSTAEGAQPEPFANE